MKPTLASTIINLIDIGRKRRGGWFKNQMKSNLFWIMLGMMQMQLNMSLPATILWFSCGRLPQYHYLVKSFWLSRRHFQLHIHHWLVQLTDVSSSLVIQIANIVNPRCRIWFELQKWNVKLKILLLFEWLQTKDSLLNYVQQYWTKFEKGLKIAHSSILL